MEFNKNLFIAMGIVIILAVIYPVYIMEHVSDQYIRMGLLTSSIFNGIIGVVVYNILELFKKEDDE